MAFCNSCGGAMEAGAKFCPKCGAAAAAAASPAVTPAVSGMPAAPPAKSGNALKIILIIVAVIVGLGVLGVVTLGVMIHHYAHVETKDGNTKVETPFGSVETTQDAGQAAKDVGIDIYPGATVMKNGAANMSFGSMHTSTVQFESDDAPATVAEFYKSKFPGAAVTSNNDRYSIVSGDKANMTTITIQPVGGKTRIQAARVSKAGG